MLEHGVSEWDMTRFLRTYVQNTFVRNRQTVFDVLRHNYASWHWPRDRVRIRDLLAALLGDGQMMAPSVAAARCHVNCRHGQASTFMYVLQLPETSPKGETVRCVVVMVELRYEFRCSVAVIESTLLS